MKNFFNHLIGLAENALARTPLPRIPESEMVVETPEELTDYNRAMQESSWIYVVFSAELISEVIQDCTRVLDIGCGSGDLLLTVAQANPHITFVGADQSDIAIEVGRRNAQTHGVTNVTFVKSNLETLEGIESSSFNGVITRFTLHHLADDAALRIAFQSIQRVLSPDGALWIGDFQRLKSERLIRTICYRKEKKAGTIVSDLFYESLHAAFDYKTLITVSQGMFAHGRGFLSQILPLYFIYRTARHSLPPDTQNYFRTLKKKYTLRDRGILLSVRIILALGGYYTRP